MSEILLITQVVLTILIVILVMLQKSSSMGLGAYSGSNESMFGAKGPTSFLSKSTMFIGLLFVLNTLSLGYVYNKSSASSIVDGKIIPSQTSTPSTQDNSVIPKAPSVPSGL